MIIEKDPLENTGIYQPKNVINHPNYHMVEKNIHVIKNFTTQEERDFFIKIAEQGTPEQWNKDKRFWWNKKILFVGDENLENQHILNISGRIKELFEDENEKKYSYGGLASVHRMKPGEKMFEHSDNPSGFPLGYNSSDLTNFVIFGMVLYHNDFNGGDVHYRYLNLSYKPEAGDLLMHPGSFKYTHKTKPVLEGPNRYISTMFIYDKNGDSLRSSGKVFSNMKNGKNHIIKDPISAYHKD